MTPRVGGTTFAQVVCVLNWQRVLDLLGETIREIGVLILVFAPLESVFAPEPIQFGYVIVPIVIGLVMIGGGIMLEAAE